MKSFGMFRDRCRIFSGSHWFLLEALDGDIREVRNHLLQRLRLFGDALFPFWILPLRQGLIPHAGAGSGLRVLWLTTILVAHRSQMLQENFHAKRLVDCHPSQWPSIISQFGITPMSVLCTQPDAEIYFQCRAGKAAGIAPQNPTGGRVYPGQSGKTHQTSAVLCLEI